MPRNVGKNTNCKFFYEYNYSLFLKARNARKPGDRALLQNFHHQWKGPGSLPNREWVDKWHADSEDSPDELISVGCSNFFFCFSLIVFIQDGLGKHLLQFTGWEWTRAAAFHAAELWLEWYGQEAKGKKKFNQVFRETKKPQWLNASFNGKQINRGLEHRLWDGKGPLFSEKPHSKQENHETKTQSPSLILPEDVYQPKPQYMKMGSRWGKINHLAD